MGRKPNPIIGEYFTRGPKLTDSSNRYPHTCKLCGENFPKGRGEVLHKHITERCPAISPEDRINAALGFAGLNSGASHQRPLKLSAGPLNGTIASVSETPETWSALRTLAEASRQVGANELGPASRDVADGNVPHEGVPENGNGFELQEQFTLENPPPSYDPNHRDRKDDESNPLNYLSTEEKLEHLQAATQPPAAHPVDASSGMAVAAAATARLNDSLIDSQLRDVPSQEMADSVPGSTHDDHAESGHTEQPPAGVASPAGQQPQQLQQPQQPQQPWGEMSYVPANPVQPTIARPLAPVAAPTRGGTRMSIGNGIRSEHKRKAYTPSRRKEVQAARKKGACIRCRILRKTCGLNDPCDQCRKINGPRHWTYPCVRTHLNQVLTLYSAGLIVVLAQNRVNQARQQAQLLNNGTTLRVSLWNDSVPMSLPALVTPRQQEGPEQAAQAAQQNGTGSFQVAMIDQTKEDLSQCMESYLEEMLPLLKEREPSHFIRVVLDFAQRTENKTGDLVKRAIDLWGLIEILDRERSWCISEERGKGSGGSGGGGSGSGENGQDGEANVKLLPLGPYDNAGAEEQDIYNLMTWQLSAAAERKANSVSQRLVSELQRCLENGKVTLHFDVYLSILILLHCVEKTTWTIKVWEMEDFRQRWPLERPPSAFTTQGHEIAELFKMLLTLRKAHPKTFKAPGGRLSVEDSKDPAMVDFFNALNLQYDEVVDRVEHCAFTPESSRSLELHFSGLILLPRRDGSGANGAHPDYAHSHTALSSPMTAPSPHQHGLPGPQDDAPMASS